MGTKFVQGQTLVTEECCSCGMMFAMTQNFHDRRRKDRRDFYCPAGHRQHYAGQTEEQKLRRELERTSNALEAERGRAAAIEHQRNAVARAHKRMRERVSNGVCPCCNRTFQNLMQHMKSQHPEFGKHQILKALRDTFGLSQSALAGEIRVSANHVSAYERQKPVAGYAADLIESWIASHQ